MKSRILQLDSRDNVLVALADLKQGEAVQWAGRSYALKTDVSAKHKFATTDLAAGDRVVMYGVLVGQAVKPISAGEALTLGNIRHVSNDFCAEYQGSRTLHEDGLFVPGDVDHRRRHLSVNYGANF